MILPTNEECQAMVEEMLLFDDQLTEFEYDFVHSNTDRTVFSSRQKEILAEFAEKYDLHSY